MPRRPTRKSPPKKRRRVSLRTRLAKLWPSRRKRRRALKAFVAAPLVVQATSVVLVLIALWALTNGIFQVLRKPAELFFPVAGALAKLPAETWREYERIFRKHATEVITPEFLAALAQVEGAGNPVAAPDWQWYATWDLLEIYRPASSAVGMYQITDGTFAEARRYCIHNHKVVEDGPWHQLDSCWFNSLYSRVVPTHATEMTAAFLDRRIAAILERHRLTVASVQQKQDLAAVIHLCGAGAGNAYAQCGFRLAKHQRCGHHDVQTYLVRVRDMKAVFAAYATK